MFRTIKVALPCDNSLIQTAIAFNRACQIVLDYGSQAKTYNKNKLNRETYRTVRAAVPNLPSALVQTARDEASEMLKRNGFVKIVKKYLSVRYDNRAFKFYPDTRRVSLTTVFGRVNFSFKHYPYLDHWKGEYTNAQLLMRGKRIFLNIQVKTPDTAFEKSESPTVLGIDRGVRNMVVCSDNSFFNSKRLRAVKGRYQYLRRRLQHVGTRSAKRHLKRVGGRERRFVLDVNHCISKTIVSQPFTVFALEQLRDLKKRKNGRRFNSKLGSWSFAQFQRFLQYKAEQVGKTVVSVNPRHTSQTCSRCGYYGKANRKGVWFKCGRCGFQLDADLNASRNIGVLGKSEYLRLFVNEPNVASDESMPTGVVDDSYKPTTSVMGS
jgi:IS605 OrfB family transposase